jgi:prepilin-type N-terminal cleavage/methylation domain-containing protein
MERQKMKKKGFTLVELLVVIAIIAMLLAILMPALSKVRQLAQRLMCGTNLVGIGKATLSYTTEDKYESFPVAGSSGTRWDMGTGSTEGKNSFDWRNAKVFPEPTSTVYTVTISANLYLLVKYADVAPEQFVCPGTDQKKFELTKYDMTGYTTATILDVWDFGSRDKQKGGSNANTRGKGHQSYSYQSPVRFLGNTATDHESYAVSTASSPRRPVMADRSPYWQLPVDTTSTARFYHWDRTNSKVAPSSITNGNSMSHQKDGQNVLFADLHSSFEKSANCGIEMDNIYTVWGKELIETADDDKWRQCGVGAPDAPVLSTTGRVTTPFQTQIKSAYYPRNADDTFLVSDLDG